MLTKPTLYLTFENDMIHPDDVEAISMYSAVDRTLPEMNFKINDRFGGYESGLKFYIGARISALLANLSYASDKITENNTDVTKPIELTNFSVCGTMNNHTVGDTAMSGELVVYCRQSWYLWGDYQGHAYAPQKLSKLIKTICSNANTNAGIVVDNDNFVESSDPGNIPRYKTCESDLNFIEAKLLPYTNIEDSNCFFYVDFYNKPHLTSFNQMKFKKPKVILTPPPEIKNTVMDLITNYKKTNSGLEEYAWKTLNTRVGDKDINKQLGQIKEHLLLENNSTGKVYVCGQRPSANMGKSSGKNINGALPFSSLIMEGVHATSSKIFPNRILADSLAMARNDDAYLDDMIYIEVSVENFITDLVPGDTIYLFVPQNHTNELSKSKDTDAKDANNHSTNWHQGKWVVYSIRADFDNVSKGIATTLGLMRPTLIYNTDVTTVFNPDKLYIVNI